MLALRKMRSVPRECHETAVQELILSPDRTPQSQHHPQLAGAVHCDLFQNYAPQDRAYTGASAAISDRILTPPTVCEGLTMFVFLYRSKLRPGFGHEVKHRRSIWIYPREETRQKEHPSTHSSSCSSPSKNNFRMACA